jgi:hypothetical protein
MKLFKTSPSKIATLIASVAFLGLASQNAAALTASATPVINTATLSYNVGGNPQNPILSSAPTPGNPLGNSVSSPTLVPAACVYPVFPATTPLPPAYCGTPTTFLVDKKVDLSIVANGVTNVTPGSAAQVLTYTLTNLGNDPQGFTLAAIDATGLATPVDTFNTAAAPVVFVDTNGNGVYDPLIDTAAAVATLAPGAAVKVFVVAPIPLVNSAATPGALVTGDQAVVTLTATAAATGTVAVGSTVAGTAGPVLTATAPAVGANATNGTAVTVVDVVFADVATVAVATAPSVPADAANNGTFSANNVYVVATATLSVLKTATPICDPATGITAPTNIPGAYVQYSITIFNTGVAGVANLAKVGALTDPLLLTSFDANKSVGIAGPAATAVAAAALCTGPAAAANLSGVYATRGVGTVPATFNPATATPIPAADVVAPAANVTGGTLSVNLQAALPVAVGAPLGTVVGDLLPGQFITVFFNAIVP